MVLRGDDIQTPGTRPRWTAQHQANVAIGQGAPGVSQKYQVRHLYYCISAGVMVDTDSGGVWANLLRRLHGARLGFWR